MHQICTTAIARIVPRITAGEAALSSPSERNYRQDYRQDKACHVGLYAAMGCAAALR